MAIHTHNTPSGVNEPGLPRTGLLPLAPFVFRPTPPVDNPRSAVEILDEIRREIERQEVSAQTVQKLEPLPEPLLEADLLHGLARHGAAPIANPQEVQGADTLRTLHARRALEQALDHGTALLAALGLPQLVEPGSTRVDPGVVGAHLDEAIALLDAIDAADEDLEDDDPLEKVGDDELDLGWSANVSQLALGPNMADGDLTAPERHGRGFVRCGPDDAEDDDPGGTDDGEDASHFTGVLRFIPRVRRTAEATHV